LSYLEHKPFITFDHDYDGNGMHRCAKVHGSGWWFVYSSKSTGCYVM
jgi:hypothetical protein